MVWKDMDAFGSGSLISNCPFFHEGQLVRPNVRLKATVDRQTQSPHRLTNRRKAVPVGGDSPLANANAGFGVAVQVLCPTVVRLSQVITHRFARFPGIARRHRGHYFMMFSRNRSPGFWVVKMGRELSSQRSVALVKQSHDYPQKYFVPEFRRDVPVKLPIAG